MKFFYDSLETLQKVTFASKKDYIMLSIGVLVSVIVFGAFFIGIDTVFSGGYKTFYTLMKGDATSAIEQIINNNSDDNGSGEVITVLPGGEETSVENIVDTAESTVEPIITPTEDIVIE